jgi:hypothetical protein
MGDMNVKMTYLLQNDVYKILARLSQQHSELLDITLRWTRFSNIT